MEYINKEMLELFFEKEQTAGGGKVKYIDIDNKNKCVFVDFEEKSGKVYINIINCIQLFVISYVT
jgi:hypothetical protein